MKRQNNLEKVKLLTESEAAYIAGFLDADGTVHFQIKPRYKKENRKQFHFHPVLSFANNRKAALDFIQEKCGGFGVMTTVDHNKVEWNRSYRLTFSSSVIRWLLPQIGPYTIIKKRQVDLMIEYTGMSNKVKGGKIKTDKWLSNMQRYLQIYGEMRCLNHDIDYSMVFKKSGELLENPQNHERYNVIGNDERERLKSFMDWIISSQTYRKCCEYLSRWEGSQTTA